MEKWVVCPKFQPAAAIRLFCFPYAGTGVAVFRNWGEDLSPAVEVCGIQLPGREHRWSEPPVGSIDELIPPLVEGLRPWLNRPYAFYGHSLGARIAFEVARALRGTGLPQPSHLFVGASPAPQIPWSWPALRSMEDGDFLDEIQRRYGGIPKQILAEPELLAALLPTLRADVALMETYRYIPEGPLDCPITAIGGAGDRIVPPSALQAWWTQTRNCFELHLLEGDHFFLQSQRQRLLGLISAELARLPDRQWVSSAGV
jgi:medium-chain acyl-[acyl-carrier-protein] hydrolase